MLKRMFQESLREAVAELKEEMRPRGDLVSATREIMKIVNPDVLELDEMDKRDSEEILKGAHEVMQHKAFEYVLSGLIKEQIKHTVSEGYKEDHYTAGRSVIVGINLVRETMDRLSKRFEALGELDKFNKEDLI